jgi:hypothetical protein
LSIRQAKHARDKERATDIAHLLAIYDEKEKLLEHSPELRQHYLRVGWIALRLGTLSERRQSLNLLATLVGAQACADAYYEREGMEAPALTVNVEERKLWMHVATRCCRHVLDFFGLVGGESGDTNVRGKWASVTEEQL